MILSHAHHFIFIKGVKVAGTSAEIALSQICGADDVITPITPIDELHRVHTPGTPRNYSTDPDAEADYLRLIRGDRRSLTAVKAPRGSFYNHMSLTEVLDQIPEADAYRLLFVERSPYEKVISFANWHPNQQRYKAGEPLPRASTRVISEAVDNVIGDGSFLKVRNIERYRDANGRIRSRGWRFEQVQQELANFIAEQGAGPISVIHAKRGFGSPWADIAEILRRDQIDTINTAFAEEFQAFGYEMS